MHRAAGLQAAAPGPGRDVDHRALAATHREPRPVGALGAGPHVQQPGQHPSGRFQGGLRHRDRVQPADRVLGGHPPGTVPAGAGVAGGGDQVDDEAVRVAQRQRRLAVAVDRPVGVDLQVGQVPLPPSQRLGRDAERGRGGQAGAVAPGGHPLPGEECQDRRRPPGRVPVVEVVGARVVEVHRLLDQPQPQHPGVEVDVALRVRRDGRDVVQAARADVAHAGSGAAAERGR